MKFSQPAFPTWIVDNSMAHGMLLRDYFASLAMSGMLAKSNSTSFDTIAEYSYLIADKMLKEREK